MESVVSCLIRGNGTLGGISLTHGVPCVSGPVETVLAVDCLTLVEYHESTDTWKQIWLVDGLALV